MKTADAVHAPSMPDDAFPLCNSPSQRRPVESATFLQPPQPDTELCNRVPGLPALPPKLHVRRPVLSDLRESHTHHNQQRCVRCRI
jgi:hypothetical protein